MKIALYLNLLVYFDGKDYTSNERYFEFWTNLTLYFEKVFLLVHVIFDTNMKGNFGVDLKEGRVVICRLPRCSAFALYKLPQLYDILSKSLHLFDIVGAVVPSLTGNLFLQLARKNERPYFAYIRGNVKKSAWFELTGFKRWSGYAYFGMLDVWTRGLIRSGLAFAVGQDLVNAYSRESSAVHRIVVSVISGSAIHGRPPHFRDANKTRLLHVGRLSSEKGVVVLLEALRQLKRKYQRRFELTVAGSGPEEIRLKENAKSLGIEKNVRFLGYVREDAELSRLYQESDVFILPSFTEGVPKVILEAMANGLPVVATSVGGIPEIIQNGENGLLVPPGDAEGICESVYRLLIDQKLCARVRTSAIETARMYTMERQGENIIRLLNGYFDLNVAAR